MIEVAARAEAAARMLWETWASIPAEHWQGWGVQGHFEGHLFVPDPVPYGPVWAPQNWDDYIDVPEE